MWAIKNSRLQPVLQLQKFSVATTLATGENLCCNHNYNWINFSYNDTLQPKKFSVTTPSIEKILGCNHSCNWRMFRLQPYLQLKMSSCSDTCNWKKLGCNLACNCKTKISTAATHANEKNISLLNKVSVATTFATSKKKSHLQFHLQLQRKTSVATILKNWKKFQI
jgi:hypothetical protein